jgi:putative transposase
MGEQRRGRSVSEADCKAVQSLVDAAISQGCRQAQACEAVGIDAKTYQRWALKPILGDQRQGPTSVPANKFTAKERANIISISIEKDFVNLSPHKIVPTLADRGEYVASESSFYRILAEEKLLQHRGRAKPKQMIRPQAYEATKPNQLYSWDITYLRSSVRGEYFYLYLFLDLFSRKIVGHEVYEVESMELSSKLLQRICLTEGIEKNQLHVHSDNGGPMKGATMLVTMQWLGVVPSFSRPSVSNDNPFSESLFKTLKYCPEYPSKPFDNIEDARDWVDKFVSWYNNQHLHSGINFVTPESKHKGEDIEILNKRNIIYLEAKRKNPNRWSGKTRDWSPIESVKLNHLKKEKLSATKVELSKSC